VVFVAGALPPPPHKERSFLDLVQKAKSFWCAFFSKRGQKERDHAKHERPAFFNAIALKTNGFKKRKPFAGCGTESHFAQRVHMSLE
jgi:hypothetical protein